MDISVRIFDDSKVNQLMSKGADFVTAVAVLTVLSGCGGRGGPSLAPTPPSAAEAIDDSAPLTVDWPAGMRADLEVVSAKNVAVVEVKQDSIAVLTDCALPGSYGFVGVTPKEQLIRLQDAYEVAVNLPIGGPGIAAQLGGELGQSASLDVALVIVGKRTTPRSFAPRELLQGGDCSRATHFVRGMSIGAFAMQASSKGSASTVAGLFGVGASAAASSAKSVRQVDGRLDACKASSTGAEQPPEGCGALLRLDLKPIGEPEHVVDPSCAGTLVRGEGKCAQPQPQLAFECKPDDLKQCEEQCEAGNGASCAHWGYALRRNFDRKPDFEQLVEISRKGCQSGSESACVLEGELYQYGNGVPIRYKKAGRIFSKACDAGEPMGCYKLGVLLDVRPGLRRDLPRARKLYDRACRAGNAAGCNNLAAMLILGKGGKADDATAAGVYESACSNGSTTACGNLGDLYSLGKGVSRDAKRAVELWEKACERSGGFCVRLGDAYSTGGLVPIDQTRAATAYASAVRVLRAQCDLGEWEQCIELAWVLHGGKAGEQDDRKAVALLKQACAAGTPSACTDLGIFHEEGWGTRKDAAAAKKAFEQACDMRDPQGCTNLALQETGEKREDILETACSKGSPLACFRRGRDLRVAGGNLERAKQLVKKACDDDLGLACAYMGRWERRSLSGLAGVLSGPPKGPTPAQKLFRRACELGHGPGCAELTRSLLSAVRPNSKRQVDWGAIERYAQLACTLESGLGCRVLAQLAEEGRTKVVGAESVQPLLRRACAHDDPQSCADVGSQLLAADADQAAALQLLARACDPEAVKEVTLGKPPKIKEPDAEVRSGKMMGAKKSASSSSAAAAYDFESDPSQQLLGVLGERNRGIRQNQAVNDAFDMGTRPLRERQAGCGPLAQALLAGPEALRDEKRGARLADVACKSHVGSGCTLLGLRHDGAKEKEKREEALDMFRLGCERGDSRGCYEAAEAFRRSTRKGERLEAVRLYVKACSKQHADACFEAGRRKKGRRDGFEKTEALELFRRGCDFGEAKACSEGARLARRKWDEHAPDAELSKRLKARACELGRKQDCRR